MDKRITVNFGKKMAAQFDIGKTSLIITLCRLRNAHRNTPHDFIDDPDRQNAGKPRQQVERLRKSHDRPFLFDPALYERGRLSVRYFERFDCRYTIVQRGLYKAGNDETYLDAARRKAPA